MRVDLLYGMAGLVGSLVSGHLYPLLSSSLGAGTLLAVASIMLHVLGLLHAAVLLKVRVPTVTTHACQSLLALMVGIHHRFPPSLSSELFIRLRW